MWCINWQMQQTVSQRISYMPLLQSYLSACVLLQSWISLSRCFSFTVARVQTDLSVFYPVGSRHFQLAVADWTLCAGWLLFLKIIVGVMGRDFLSRCFLHRGGFVWVFNVCFWRDGLMGDTEEQLLTLREEAWLLFWPTLGNNSPHWRVKWVMNPPVCRLLSLSFYCEKIKNGRFVLKKNGEFWKCNMPFFHVQLEKNWDIF